MSSTIVTKIPWSPGQDMCVPMFHGQKAYSVLRTEVPDMSIANEVSRPSGHQSVVVPGSTLMIFHDTHYDTCTNSAWPDIIIHFYSIRHIPSAIYSKEAKGGLLDHPRRCAQAEPLPRLR